MSKTITIVSIAGKQTAEDARFFQDFVAGQTARPQVLMSSPEKPVLTFAQGLRRAFNARKSRPPIAVLEEEWLVEGNATRMDRIRQLGAEITQLVIVTHPENARDLLKLLDVRTAAGPVPVPTDKSMGLTVRRDEDDWTAGAMKLIGEMRA